MAKSKQYNWNIYIYIYEYMRGLSQGNETYIQNYLHIQMWNYWG